MWDLATAKARLNITTTTQDAEVQMILDAALAYAEGICDRQFLYAAQQARFYYVQGSTLQVRRYPIDQVMNISLDVDHKVHRTAGRFEFPGWLHSQEVTIDFTGGYKVLPADLELALWMVFDSLWADHSGGAGGGLTAGAVESVTLSQVGTVRFATGASAQVDASAMGGIPPKAVSILDRYRRVST
jgi:hypothetical protein